MTKDIKQIQEENRKLILEAIFGTREEALKNNNLSPEIKGNYSSLPMTLSRVLLALNDKVLFCEGHLCEHSVTCDGLIITTNHIMWDLQKETLEEQSEGTQIAINQLLTK